jgi:hypothetical protein
LEATSHRAASHGEANDESKHRGQKQCGKYSDLKCGYFQSREVRGRVLDAIQGRLARSDLRIETRKCGELVSFF